MKKRILTMVLALTMIMGILTGCGADSANKITVSEMINSVLEEKGEVVMYYVTKSGKNYTPDYVPTKNLEGTVTYYNGESLTAMSSKDKKLGNYLNGTSEANIPARAIQDLKVDLKTITDEEGTVLYEAFCAKQYGAQKETAWFKFGEFSRVEIEGVSCMVFAVYSYDTDSYKLKYVDYVVIEDTEYTKDKTVVFDKTNDEGIKGNTVYTDLAGHGFVTSDKNWTPNK